jgi:hypothetical protein
MAGFRIVGPEYSGGVMEVDSSNNGLARIASSADPSLVGANLTFSQVDSGSITGTNYIVSAETDDDRRLRISLTCVLCQETFDYTAQNTGKHAYNNTTMTASWAVGAMSTNSGNSVTPGEGMSFNTYATFPIVGILAMDIIGAFSAQPVTNTTVDFGLFIPGTGPAYAPLDGAYFRLTSAGLFGVINYNGTETVSTSFGLAYTTAQKYHGRIVLSGSHAEFWVNGVLYKTVDTPVGNGSPVASAALPFSIRHAIEGGNASGALQLNTSSYGVTSQGFYFYRELGTIGNATYGAYQGLSGGTMGSLALYGNSTTPTPGIPTNTTAALGTGLGGQVTETESNTFALTTDGIILSYQNPQGTVSVQGRRLRLTGVTIQSYVQTALTGGPYVAQWSLAFGHTSVSLATAEAINAKAPRRIPLGLQALVVTAAANTVLQPVQVKFQEPVYINPGEFIAVVKKKIGTIATAGAINHTVCYEYSWE